MTVWNRYKDYLSNTKWSKPVVERLHNTTEDVMDDLGNPKVKIHFRRGLCLEMYSREKQLHIQQYVIKLQMQDIK